MLTFINITGIILVFFMSLGIVLFFIGCFFQLIRNYLELRKKYKEENLHYWHKD